MEKGLMTSTGLFESLLWRAFNAITDTPIEKFKKSTEQTTKDWLNDASLVNLSFTSSIINRKSVDLEGI